MTHNLLNISLTKIRMFNDCKDLKLRHLMIFQLLFLFCSYALAEQNDAINSVLKIYKEATLVQMQVTKLVKSELMEKETKFDGTMYFSSGKVRWENKTPEKTWLIFDGSTLWNVQFPSADFPGPIQVARGKVDAKSSSKVLISKILSTGNVSSTFKVLDHTAVNSMNLYKLETKEKDPMVQELSIQVNADKNVIAAIEYKDDIGNKTTLKFSAIEFKDQARKGLFKYVPPKGAQVTDL